jgi:hypothetical protein
MSAGSFVAGAGLSPAGGQVAARPSDPPPAAGKPEVFRRRQAPWHFLNFLPEPHQHGSLRPSFYCSDVTRRCCVATAAPPPPTCVVDAVEAMPPPAAAPAAAIASDPDSDSC